jgi:hypothetical protein
LPEIVNMITSLGNICLLASCGDYLITIREKGILAAMAERAAARTVTNPILLFELLIVVAAVCVYLVCSRGTQKFWLRALVMAVGIFLFELFTSPMWNNDHLGRWAYVYCDVSWVLTLGWTAMLLAVVTTVDRWRPGWKAGRRFAVYLGILLPVVTLAEIAVVALGIRSYAPEVLNATSGVFLMGVPIEILYYVPVFLSLVIAFYKYWNLVIDDTLLVPVKKRKWLRAVLLATIAVTLFELMVEPIVTNDKFPAWSYIYRDISFLYTGWRVLLIAVAAVIIDRFLIGKPIPLRFAAAVLLISALALPFESWFIMDGYRIYGDSAVAGYTGFTMPLTGVPVEIAFAIPCYMSLIIGFIRYWEIVFDNRL